MRQLCFIYPLILFFLSIMFNIKKEIFPLNKQKSFSFFYSNILQFSIFQTKQSYVFQKYLCIIYSKSLFLNNNFYSAQSKKYPNHQEHRMQSYQSDGSPKTSTMTAWTKSDRGNYKDVTLYHGTDIKAAISIKKSGQFKPSKSGFKGPGIYFTDDKDKAFKIGRNKSINMGQKGTAVLTCRVRVYEKYWRTGWHGEWKGVCSGFIEYCVQKQYSTIDIIDLDYKQYYQIDRQRVPTSTNNSISSSKGDNGEVVAATMLGGLALIGITLLKLF